MSPSRRDLLRLRLSEVLGTRAGQAVPQQQAPDRTLPGCSAERGYQEAPPPWLRPREDDA